MARADLLFSNDTRTRHAASWYAASASPGPLRESLSGSVNCDICIIGAGFTGLSAALHLAGLGYDVVVVDAHRVGWGASGRNGGQLGSGQRVDQETLEQRYGNTEARALWSLAEQSKSLVRHLIKQHGIACDYQPGIINADHKVRFSASTKAYVQKLRSQYDYSSIDYLEGSDLQDVLGTQAYHSASIDTGAGHLHPLKYALGLADAATSRGAKIYESTQVLETNTESTPVRIVTSNGEISAKYLLLACNGYLGNLQPDIAARVMPINNYILATSPLPEDTAEQIIRNNMAVADSRFVVNYYRKSSDRRLLFGGRESYGYRFPDDIKAFVRSAMLKIYPQLQNTAVEYGWGGTLAITMNRMPHLRSITPNVITASGYSGHGVGMATLSGQLAAEAIDGTLSRFDVMAKIKHQRFPGGVAFRSPLMKLGMLYYSLRDLL